ncbi:GAF and ANTAR domain-containing protein [Nocardia asiatica]|uniref:GAF and ANTAR domain-containing protein n=1 Tax=Nocardia asiatica TaxID=209252 RepID=UPI0002E21847|nr:GAF and ANTAR domain-containing protein [Nocardia asiatica]
MPADLPPTEGSLSDLAATQHIAAAFARMSGLFLSAETVTTALQLITALSVEMVPRTAGAGITLLDREGERVTAAATDRVVEAADSLQYELETGPCLDAWANRTVVRVDDFAVDDRWPLWSRRAAQLGLRSSVSAPLVAGTQALGAIKVYAAEPNSYGAREDHLLTMFSAQAAMLLSNMRAAEDAERVSAQIADQLRTREAVTLAKGIVMARDGVDERTAFLTLAHSASDQRTTLRRVAERLTQSTVRRLR